VINKSPLNEKIRPDLSGGRSGPFQIEKYVINGCSAAMEQPYFLYEIESILKNERYKRSTGIFNVFISQ
jgi:hypothetical protein